MEQQLIESILNKIPAPEYQNANQQFFTEANYYGAARLIAEQLGLTDIPFSLAGWRHGWVHFPIKYVRQLTVWGSEDAHFLLGQQTHVDFLATHNIKATAVGLPFIYANAVEHSLRIPNTLLVMPPHTLPYIPSTGNEENYIKQIDKIRHQFDAVVFCIHHSCFENGIWPELLKKYEFPMIIGASANQVNALTRLQKIFSCFEYVTTNTVGSHLPYAAYCGAKVSIYGEFSDFSHYNIEKDPYAKANPELMEFNIKHTEEAFIRKLVPFLFCEHPKLANQHIEWAQTELGQKYKKEPGEIATLLGWYNQNVQMKKHKEQLAIEKNRAREVMLNDIGSMLKLATSYKNNFAIYGAGDVGITLIKLLAAVGLKPICVFDRKYQSQNNVDGIEIRNPEDVSAAEIQLILVASFAFQYEIKNYITSIRKDIKLWLSS